MFYTFMVIAHSSISHEKVRVYFEQFPLYSSKYLAYKDWCRVQDLLKMLSRGVFTAEQMTEVEFIKSQFNSKRKLYDFAHLESLTL